MMLLAAPAFAQEWTLLPSEYWYRESGSEPSLASPDGEGTYKVSVRGGTGLAYWDSSFFVTFGKENALNIGDVMSVTFKVKADAPATFETQSHRAPNAYVHWGCIGNVSATTSWEEIVREVTVDKNMEGMYTICFNLTDGQENNAYFKDFEVKVKREKVIDSWTDIIVNGDMEGESSECFYVTEQGIGGPFLANFTEGIGVDGSRAVKVESYDNPSADWDTQFFIRMPYQLLPEGKFRISFDYKADKVGDFDTQSDTEPGCYIHYACVGSGTFTTEWQHYEAEGTVSSDMSKEDKLFQTIAFNLAKNKERTNFIFDNVKFEVPTEVLATLTKNPAVDPKPYTRPAYNSMVIVGDFLIGDDKWEPANGWEMEQDAENPAVWTLTKEFTAEAKTYEYKATANGRWGDYELPDKGNAEFNFDDPNLGAGAYSLTFTVDTRLHALDLSVKKLGLTTYTATFTTNADYWTDVYAYAWSGEEPNVKKFLGDWPGTKLTPDGAGVYTVSIEAADAPEKIIFNNGNSGEGNQTADLDFVNGAAYEFKAASGEEDPIKEAPAGWTNAVTNGNLAGDDVSSFVAKEYPSVVFDPAVIYAGAGTKGSRGILVKTADETEVSGATDWDSQFYIVLPEALPEGSKLHIEFDYKASEAAKASTQSHGNPGAYQHWAAIGDVNFTTEWQTFSTEFEVDASMAKGNNGTGSGTGLKSICFNLAVNKNAVEYHFDNFGVWYQKPVNITNMAIVGDFLGLSTEGNPNADWDPANGWEMEQDAQNNAIWTVTKTFTAKARKYEYKAIANGNWEDYVLPANNNADFVFGTNEYPAGNYNLTFTADTENHTLNLVAEPVEGNKEVYSEFVEATGTLTYYYDGKINFRSGVTELFDPIKYPDAVRFADYYKKVTKVAIDPSMKEAPLTSFRNMSYGGFNEETFDFYFLQNVTSIEGLENLNTEIVTDMNSMFTMYTSLEELDLSSFNTSKVTNMNGMFLGCNKLQTLDLTSFDVSNVTDMRMMFGSCFELKTIYCEEDWSQVVPADNMYVMFSGCKKLVGSRGTTFDSNVINGTYARPDGGTKAPGYFTKKEVYTEFAEATGTLTYYYDNQMASREGVIEIYDPYDLSVARFSGYSDKVLTAVIDPSMQEAPLTSFESMFYGGWDDEATHGNALSQMTTIEGMENLNTEFVENLRGMFANCNALTSLDFSSFTAPYLQRMDQMFINCHSLTSLDLSTFNTEHVMNMEAMFYHCFKLQMVDLTSFNISNVYNMAFMFGSCKDLTTICCYDDWSGTSANTECMFDECSSLVGGMGTTYNPNFEDATYARPDGGTDAPGYFTAETITSIKATDNGQRTTDGEIYNLAGQRLNKTQKGINIVGGKKVMK